MIAIYPLCAVLALPGRAAPATAPPAPDPKRAVEADALEYRIGPEDMLQITVWQNADLSRTVPVRPDGKISLPLINDVQAAGLTPLQLRESVKEKLAEYVPDAEVSVIVSEVQSFKVAILGKVQRPDRYKLRGPTTVLDALALAGGFLEYADTNSIVVLRPELFFVQGRQPGKTFKRFPFDYNKVITVGGETSNFSLQPGDIIIVP